MSIRRLRVLVEGLPGDAATWREDILPPIEERLAQLLERTDQWSRAIFGALTHEGSIQVPGDIEIPRPGEHRIEEQRIETDSRKVAEWFAAFG